MRVAVLDLAPLDEFGEPALGDPANYVLQLETSAIAYDSAGIIVGTNEAIAVPEPSGLFALVSLTATGLFRRRRVGS